MFNCVNGSVQVRELFLNFVILAGPVPFIKNCGMPHMERLF